MATRFYLPDVGARASPITPAADAAWEKNSQMTRFLFAPFKTGAATDNAVTRVPNGVSGTDTVGRQYSSLPLREQTISGTLKGVIKASEVNLTDNYNAAIVARILSNDGSAVRGTLLAVFGGGTEFPITTPGTIFFPPAASQTLTSVNVKEGDRLVIELGLNQISISTANAVFRLGDGAATFFAETELLTTSLNPWLEFSQDLLFQEQQMRAYTPPFPPKMVGNRWGYFFSTLPRPVAAGGTTFLQDLTATTVLVTASMQKQVNKLLTATSVVTTGSLQKQVNKLLTATSVVVTASLVKTVLKLLTATTVLVTASLQKQVNKLLVATSVVTTGALQKQVNKILSATAVVVTASLQKQVNKLLTATTVVVTATLQSLKVIVLVLTATAVAVTASMQKQASKILAATNVVATGSMTKLVSKGLTATAVVVNASLVKKVLKNLTATVNVTADMVATFQAAGSAAVAKLRTMMGFGQ